MTRVFRAARPLVLALLVLWVAPAIAQPAGTMTWGVHVTLAIRWLDTSETESEITPFMILYALHDALVKPMPGHLNAPCLAESWTMSKDGRGTSSCARASAGNASTRIEPFATSRGINAYGRCPTWRGCSSGENGFIRAYGPRVEEAGLALIQAFPYSGPLEDVKLRQP